jgi:hypothetical protein
MGWVCPGGMPGKVIVVSVIVKRIRGLVPAVVAVNCAGMLNIGDAPAYWPLLGIAGVIPRVVAREMGQPF